MVSDAFKEKEHQAEAASGQEATSHRVAEETYRGVVIRSFTGPDASGPKAYFTRKGTLSLMSLSERLLKGVLDRSDDPNNKTCLASDPEFALITGKLGTRPTGSSLFFFTPKNIIEALLGPLKKGLAEQGQNEWVPKVDQLYQATGLSAVKSVASVSFPDNGVAILRSYAHTEGEVKGLIAAAFSPRTIDKKKLAWVPKSAESFNLSFTNLAQIYDSAMAMAEIVQPGLQAQVEGKITALLQPPEPPAADGKEPTSAQPPPKTEAYDLRKDLLGNLDGESLYYQTPGQGIGATGNFVVVGKVINPDKVKRGLDLILKIPSRFELPVNTREETFEDTKITMLDLTQVLGPMAAFAGSINPCFAFRGDYLVGSSTMEGLKTALQRMKTAPADSVLDSEDFSKAWARLPADRLPISVAYTNVRASFESTYNGLVTFTMMPPLSQILQQVPIDLALLPTAETVSKHLFGAVSAAYHDQEGELSLAFSPVGAEAAVLAGAAAIFVGMSSYKIQKVGEAAGGAETPTKVSPAEQVEVDVSLLRAAITVYRLDREKLPASLQDLIESSENFPNGYLGGSKQLPKDPWNHDYVYVVTGPKGYQIRSMGPNGVDDQGQGDDIAPGRR
jgi:hypothetical protein